MRTALILLTLFGILTMPLFAQGASEDEALDYCLAQEMPCVKECCEKVGPPWYWSEAEQDCVGETTMTDDEIAQMLVDNCPECVDELITCTENYQTGGTPLTPSMPSGCCATFVLPLIIGAALYLRQ